MGRVSSMGDDDPADRDEPCQWKVAADALADYGEQALARAERAEAERDKLRADYAALVNSQLLTRHGELGTRLVRAEATIDRVRALADEWDERWDRPISEGKPMTTREIRAALDGEGEG